MFARFKMELNSTVEDVLEKIHDDQVFMQKGTIGTVVNSRYEWENADDPEKLRIKGKGMLLAGFWEMKAKITSTGYAKCELSGILILAPVQRLIFGIILMMLGYFMIKNGIKYAGTSLFIPSLVITVIAMAVFFFIPKGILHLWLIKIKKQLRETYDRY